MTPYSSHPSAISSQISHKNHGFTQKTYEYISFFLSSTQLHRKKCYFLQLITPSQLMINYDILIQINKYNQMGNFFETIKYKCSQCFQKIGHRRKQSELSDLGSPDDLLNQEIIDQKSKKPQMQKKQEPQQKQSGDQKQSKRNLAKLNRADTNHNQESQYDKNHSTNPTQIGKDSKPRPVNPQNQHNQIIQLTKAQRLEQIHKLYQKGLFLVCQKQIQTFIQESGNDSADLSYCYAFLAQILINLKNKKSSIENFKKALVIYEKEESLYFEEMITIYNNLGLLYQEQSQSQESIKFYGKCLSLMNKYFNKMDQRIFLVQINLCFAYFQNKKQNQGLKLYERINEKSQYLSKTQNSQILELISQLKNEINKSKKRQSKWSLS